MMNSQFCLLVFATVMGSLTLSCSQISPSFLPQASTAARDNQDNQSEYNRSTALQWLLSADPEVDANLAIQRQDFSLLAFAGRATSFPGMGSTVSTLQQSCGYRLLPNSGDALRSKNALSLRKKLYQYAAAYNQLVVAACQKSTSPEYN
jgi:hypothetical protein